MSGFHVAGGRQPMGPADAPLPIRLTGAESDLLTLPPPAGSGPRVVVGVVDTGVVLHRGEPHPFLAGRLAGLRPEDEDPLTEAGGPRSAESGHGTFVAGRVLLEAPTAVLDVRRALHEPGGRGGEDALVAARIGELAEDPDLAVVNLSFAGSWDERSGPAQIERALGRLFERRPGVVVVAAAANRPTELPSWPAAFTRDFPRLVAVGAVDDTGPPAPGVRRPPLASFGTRWTGVDVYSSAVRVLGPTLWHGEAGWSRWSGTSFAAATISGILARARADGAEDPLDALDRAYLPSRETTTLTHSGRAGA